MRRIALNHVCIGAWRLEQREVIPSDGTETGDNKCSGAVMHMVVEEASRSWNCFFRVWFFLGCVCFLVGFFWGGAFGQASAEEERNE